ncbi:hypothetical protein HDF16_005270 [Granulicella aggregans]|uniref:Uncharacterized protein n=1 Tax=Granulicella aggregans TaxID=474949 RepID=A0A7W7ZIF3_9BACT|nr:hypothetical protein [Granulicella aggregans]
MIELTFQLAITMIVSHILFEIEVSSIVEAASGQLSPIQGSSSGSHDLLKSLLSTSG